MNWAVRLEDVSKRYRGGGPRYATLRDHLAGWSRAVVALAARRLREPQGTLALDRVSFEVAPGEALAIIGPNGAGKTTTLKLISRITYPTGGRVRVRGRVGALIEVGSGLHPELTGRENIWLYGRIMGMTRAEIARRFDAIVDFAELAHALDTPVKMYSSGMQLRLGFSIASHLDPDVFVVDEALAVGDAGFQAKCVERMTTLVGEGRALLFVSHNLSAVEAICDRALFLLSGRLRCLGATKSVLHEYLNWLDENQQTRSRMQSAIVGTGLAVERVTLHDTSGRERYAFRTGEPVDVAIHVRVDREVKSPWFSVGFSDGRPGALILCSMLEHAKSFSLNPGKCVVRCRTSGLPLAPRVYEIWLSVREASGAADLLDWSRVSSFRIQHENVDPESPGGVVVPWMYGPVRVSHEWTVEPRLD